jgi:hypothetical protein
MVEETHSTEEIERSLQGTRQRIEERFAELSRRLQSRADAVPGWVKGMSAAALLYLMRKPLLRALGSAAKLSAPILVPIAIGKVMERRQMNRAYRTYRDYGPYGEAAPGEGREWRDPSYRS